MSVFFFDSSAIAKLYVTEVGSHRAEEIFNNHDNTILLSELAYLETATALQRIQNKRKIFTEDELSQILASFRVTFMESADERILPISLGGVAHLAFDELLFAHRIKEKTDSSIEYLKSLDSLQVTSWYMQIALTPTFVTGDSKLARVVSAYKDAKGITAEVIDLNICACDECQQIRENQTALS